MISKTTWTASTREFTGLSEALAVGKFLTACSSTQKLQATYIRAEFRQPPKPGKENQRRLIQFDSKRMVNDVEENVWTFSK